MKHRIDVLLTVFMILVLIATGCAGPATPAPATVQEPAVTVTGSVPTSSTTPEPTRTSTATSAPAPQKRTLVVALGQGVETWDPPAGWESPSEWIEMHVYDCLVFANRETGELEGWLAEKYELISPTVWRMHLRKGVKFHDGSEMTADDVKFSIDRILNGTKDQFIVQDQWAFVKEVRIVDPYTVDIETQKPDPSFPSEVSGFGCEIVSKKYVETVGDEGLANKGMGTGPFKLVDYDRESYVKLEANPDYWGEKPEVDELIFRVIPEPATRVAELLAGGVNLITGVLPEDIARIEANADLKVIHYLTDRVYELTVAHTPPPGVDGVATSIKDIRTAIDYAIDRDELVRIAGGHGKPTRTRLTPPIPCWDRVDPPLYDVNPYDPEKAKEYLKKAGYPNVPGGAEITLHGSFGQFIAQKEVAEILSAMLEEVGLEVKLDLREFSNYRETVYQGNNEELMLEALGNYTTDPWFFLFLYSSDFGNRTNNRKRYSNPAIDEIAAKANTEMDPVKRCDYVAEYAQAVAEDRATIPLFQTSDTVGMSADIQWTPPSDGNLLLHNVKYVR